MVRHMSVPFHHHATYRPILAKIQAIYASMQVYHNSIPAYVGGDMAFVCATKDGHQIHEPQMADPRSLLQRQVHQASFRPLRMVEAALPTRATSDEVASHECISAIGPKCTRLRLLDRNALDFGFRTEYRRPQIWMTAMS